MQLRHVWLPLMAAADVSLASATPIDAPKGLHQRFAVFTLVRGGPTDANYTTFVNSRLCLRNAINDEVAFDDVVFHEGNVPMNMQLSLKRQMCVILP